MNKKREEKGYKEEWKRIWEEIKKKGKIYKV